MSVDSIKPDDKYIFLSYSHCDSYPALDMVRHFRVQGYRVWYDEGITPGSEWDENIARRIEDCTFFIAYITKNYLDSQNCLDELNYARDLDNEMLLIYGEDVELPSGMKMRLNRRQAIYRHKYPDAETFYAKVFKAQGLTVCRPAGTMNESRANTQTRTQTQSRTRTQPRTQTKPRTRTNNQTSQPAGKKPGQAPKTGSTAGTATSKSGSTAKTSTSKTGSSARTSAPKSPSAKRSSAATKSTVSKSSGRDLRKTLAISLEEAHRGCNKKLSINYDMECPACKGKGQRVRTKIAIIGSVVNSAPCSQCNGTGKISKNVKIKFRIPAGVDSGYNLRLRGQGIPGGPGERPGDLYINIDILPHDFFRRVGKDLYCAIPITFAQARYGTSLRVDGLGETYSVDIPAGTKSDSNFRLQGRGIYDLKAGKRGDLYIKVFVK